MVLVRQLDRRVGECTAALGLILLEVTGMTQPRQELAFRITRGGSGDRIPGDVEFPREFNKTRGDQNILRREVAIERHLVGTGRLSDGVNADGVDAAAIEEFAGGRPAGRTNTGLRRAGRSAMVNYFIHRPVFASVIAVIMILTGLIAYSLLPVAQFPDITPPQVVVTATYPGASSQVVANTVTT